MAFDMTIYLYERAANRVYWRDGSKYGGRDYESPSAFGWRFLTDREFARIGGVLHRNWIYIHELPVWRDRINGAYLYPGVDNGR